MLAKEIRVMDVKEIDNKVKDLERKIFDLRQQVQNRQVEDLSLLNKTRRDVARLLTVKTEKLKEVSQS